MTTRERVEGRSESLNKTITELMEFLNDNADRPGGWGAKLRPFLHEKLADLAEYWYKRGVRITGFAAVSAWRLWRWMVEYKSIELVSFVAGKKLETNTSMEKRPANAVTAEVASSSPVVPAIHSKRVVSIRLNH